MIGKLPKSLVLKQNDPDRAGLWLHLRYPNIDPLMDSASFQQSFTSGIFKVVCVCVLQPRAWGVYIGVHGQFPNARSGGSEEVEGRAAATWLVSWLVPLTDPIWCHIILPRGPWNVLAMFGLTLCQLLAGQPHVWPAERPLSPFGLGFGPWPLRRL
jgi:hypothetical protein